MRTHKDLDIWKLGIELVCYIALGSLSEIEIQLIISKKLNFISDNTLNEVLKKIEILRKKLLNFIKYIKRKTYEAS